MARLFLADRQGTLVEPLGVGVLALIIVHIGQAVERDAVIGMVDAKTHLDSGFELLRFRECRGIVPRIVQLVESSEDRVEIALLRNGGRHSDDRKEERARQDAQAAQFNGASNGSDEAHRNPPC